MNLFLRSFITLICCLIINTVFANNTLNNKNNKNFTEGQLFVKFNTNTQNIEKLIPKQLWQQYGIYSIAPAFRLKELKQIMLLKFYDTQNKQQLIYNLKQLPTVTFAEQVPLYHLFCTPNDPLFGQQWSMQNTFANNALSLLLGNNCDFNNTNCASEVVIAVIDDAVLLNHQDIEPNIWTNPNETIDGIDNDLNGYIDDVNGWDAYSNDNNPTPPDPLACTHGTHVAGIVAAATNNNKGIASLGFKAKIMAIKTSNCSNAIEAGFEGIEYAIASNANIISMSWGGSNFSETYQELFDLAYSKGITCIAAAGNDNTEQPMYPASYNHIISVGASNNNNQKASFSNYGSNIDIMAPGEDIISSIAETPSSYQTMSGTSMACPFVSSTAALMLCFNPNLKPNDIEDCIKNNATNINPQNPNYLNKIGAGLINVQGIAQCLQAPPVANFTFDYDAYCTQQVIQLHNTSLGYNITSYNWQFIGGNPASATTQNPTLTYSGADVFNISLTVTNQYGSSTITKNISVGAPLATITGGGNIIQGMNSSIKINYNGSLPYNLIYTDGNNNYTINNINQNPYYITVNPTENTTYQIVSINNGFCNAFVQGQATINLLTFDENAICSYSTVIGSSAAENSGHCYYDIPNEIMYAITTNFTVTALDATNLQNVWTKKYDGLTYEPQIITKAPNGDLLMCSFQYDNNFSSSDWFVYRIDGSGNMLWAKQYVATGRQVFPRIISSDDDSYFISGWYNNTGGSSDDVGILKIDGQGNVLNAIAVAVAGDDQPNGLIADGNGGLIVTGEVEQDKTVFTLHYDKNLFLISKEQYLPDLNYYNSGPYTTIITADGGRAFLVWRNGGGELDEYATLVKLNANMEFEWAKSFYKQGFPIFSRGTYLIQDVTDNSIIVTGHYKQNNVLFPFMLKFDSNGNNLWKKTLANNVAIISGPQIMYNQNSAGKEIIWYAGIESGSLGQSDVVFIRDDTNFSTSCLITDFDFFVQNETWTKIPINDTPSSITFAVQNLNPSTANYLMSQDVQCINCPPTECAFDCMLTHSPPIACIGNEVQFSANCNANNIAHYYWIINDTLLFDSIANPTYTFTNEGTYIISLFADNDSCTEIATDSITIKAAQGFAGNDVSICIGDSVQLQAQGGVSYLWKPETKLNNPNIANPIANPDTSTQYVVEIGNANGCTRLDTLNVWVSPLPYLESEAIDTTVCGKDTLQIILNKQTPIANYTYNWQPPQGLSCTACPSPTATITQSVTYTLTIKNSSNCSIQQQHNITFYLKKDTTLIDTLCKGASFTVANHNYTESGVYTDTLKNKYACDSIVTSNLMFIEAIQTINNQTICDDESYIFNGNNYNQAGNYADTLKTILGCDSIIITNITLKNCKTIVMPNAFSPNNDGINDEFKPLTSGVSTFNLKIYNRWGQKVFETSNIYEAWHGNFNNKPCEMGVYVYLLNGVYTNNQLFTLKGNVTLVR